MKSFRRKNAGAAAQFTRRACLAGIAASGLTACTSDSHSDSTQLLSLIAGSVNPFSGGSSLTLAEVSKIPYASLGLRIGGSSQILIVLATTTASEHMWTSASRIAIQTRYGRIVETAGLAHNLTRTRMVETDPVEDGLHRLKGPASMLRELDFADRNIYGVEVRSQFSAGEPATINILGADIRVVHATEECSSQTLDWEFTNEYWADINTGMIWKSVQYVHPDVDAIELETLRPPPTR